MAVSNVDAPEWAVDVADPDSAAVTILTVRAHSARHATEIANEAGWLVGRVTAKMVPSHTEQRRDPLQPEPTRRRRWKKTLMWAGGALGIYLLACMVWAGIQPNRYPRISPPSVDVRYNDILDETSLNAVFQLESTNEYADVVQISLLALERGDRKTWTKKPRSSGVSVECRVRSRYSYTYESCGSVHWLVDGNRGDWETDGIFHYPQSRAFSLESLAKSKSAIFEANGSVGRFEMTSEVRRKLREYLDYFE